MSNPEWLILFDTGERDHVVELIRAKDEGVRHGLPATLIPLLDAYCRDNEQTGLSIDIEAARELRATVEDVCRELDPAYKAQRWADMISGKNIKAGERVHHIDLDPEHWAVLQESCTRIQWTQCADRINQAWSNFIAAGAGHLQYSEKPKQRQARAKGAKAKADNQRQIIDAAIEQFDPRVGAKAHRARIIIKRAQEQGFEHADRLPKNLRKYLD